MRRPLSVRRHYTFMKKSFIIISSFIGCVALLFMGCHRKTEAIDPVAQKECISNLRQIFAAEQQWALEHKKSTNDIPTWADLEGHYILKKPICPSGGTYTLGRIGDYPKCSVSGHELPSNYGREHP